MKIHFQIALAFAFFASFSAIAVERDYAISDPEYQQKIDVYNDGRNTFIQAFPGLVVRGATADGDKLIVQSVPNVVEAELGGKKISMTRHGLSALRQKEMATTTLMARLKTMEIALADSLGRIEKRAANTTGAKESGLVAGEEIISQATIPSLPQAAIAPEKPVCKWALNRDRTYRLQILAWVKCAGYNDLDWRGREFLPLFDAEFNGSFLDALLLLKRSTGWDITVHEDNKLIRIVAN